VRACVRACVRVCMLVSACMCVCICMCAYAYVCMCMHVQFSSLRCIVHFIVHECCVLLWSCLADWLAAALLHYHKTSVQTKEEARITGMSHTPGLAYCKSDCDGRFEE